VATTTGGGKSGLFRAWEKITGQQVTLLGRTGYIPLYDDASGWHIVRNRYTIYEGAENCADPAKVDALRRFVQEFLDGFPNTVEQLDRLGVKAKSLLSRPIRTHAEVEAWANSVFNTGPVEEVPLWVTETQALAYDDYCVTVTVPDGVHYLIPLYPRGSNKMDTADFSVPGSKVTYGPRHDYSKAAFAIQNGQVLITAEERDETPKRARGRPRKDGLPAGSAEARAADRLRQEVKDQARKERLAKRNLVEKPLTVAEEKELASITPLHPEPPKRRLARPWKERKENSS
jgi:hypothetical protein